MPRPVGRGTSYVAGLDGVRALAVAAVLAYHLKVPGAVGGLLGVGVFFTLSGYLITSILLSAWSRTGGLELRSFWLRRARRLLPALILVLLVVLTTTALVDPPRLPVRRTESLAALLYVSNWVTITQGQSYFARFAGPGPLDHLWSLAVEEQFYLVWPLLLLVLLHLLRGRLDAVARVAGALALGSFVLMALLSAPGFDHTRVYEGTDTRAGGLLVGAVLAVLWRPGRVRGSRIGIRVLLDLLGVAGLVTLGWMVVTTTRYDLSLYRGGLALLSLSTAAVLAAAAQPGTMVGRLLGVAPLRWVGERSYGIYLWHLPVVAFIPATVLEEVPAIRVVLVVGLTVLIAALSWSLVEDPIRRHGFLRVLRAHRPNILRPGHSRLLPAIVTGVLAVALVGTSALTATSVVGGSSPAVTQASGLDRPPLPPPETSGALALGPSPMTGPQRTGSPTDTATSGPTNAAGPGTSAGGRQASRGPLRTRCTSVVHIGDSTSIGLMDPAYQPDPALRVDAQYRKVGVRHVDTDISGARSIVETYQGRPNAQQAVRERLARGYSGCWVLALGTNEAANQYVGGVVPLDKRIDLIMHLIGNDPALWTTVKTLNTSGPYGDAQMRLWNAALRRACARYPNLRVYDWRSEVKTSWFIPDGIHFTTTGYGHRAIGLARALARAFPAEGPQSATCFVRSR